MSASLVVLPCVRASVSDGRPNRTAQPRAGRTRAPIPATNLARPRQAFYRRHTEGMLRRFMRCSLQSGRVPSMLGREMFRGKVSSYRMEGFDDMLIFVHDVDRCMRRLEPLQQLLLTRIAIQEYTLEEMGEMLKVNRMTVSRRYDESLDRLTGVFIEAGLLQPFNICQEEETYKISATCSLQTTYLAA